MRNYKIRNELNETKNFEDKVLRKEFRHEVDVYICDIQSFETIRSFRKNAIGGKISISWVDKDQHNLLKNSVKRNDYIKKQKKLTIKSFW